MVLFCLLISLAAALFESQYVEHVDSQGYAAATADPDYLTVAIIYTEDSEGSRALSDIFTSILPKYQYYTKVVVLDCTNDSKICPPETRASLPAMSGFQPAGLNPYTGKPLVHKRDFEGRIGQKELTDWINKYAAFFGESLDDDKLPEFLREDLNKVLLFSNKASVPLIFKGLSSLYRGRLEFGFVSADETSIQSRYQVSAFPTILVKTSSGVETYEGANDFLSIASYLQDFAATEKQAPKIKKAKETKPKAKQEIPEFEVKLLTANDFNDNLKNSQKLVLAHFFKQDDAPGWTEIKTKFNGVVELVEVDCSQSNNWEFAKELGVKRLPSLRLFPTNRKRKSQEVGYDEFFEEEVSKELKYTVQPINKNNIGSFIQSMKELQQVGFILLSDKPLSLQFKAIAADPAFKDSISFAYYNGQEIDILESFNLKRYPTILAFVTVGDEGQMQTAEYTGSMEDFKAIHYFAGQLISAFFAKKVEDTEWKEEEIPHYDSSHFNKLCVKKGGVCLIAFVEGNLNEEKNRKYLEVLQKVQAEAERQKTPTRFGWVDGLCQYEFRDAFNIPETALPNVALYFPAKKVFSNLVGWFSERDIKETLNRVVSGQLQTHAIDQVSFSNRNCAEFYEALAQAQAPEDDELLQEILEEQRRKREDNGEQAPKSGKRGRKKKRSKDEL